MKADDLEREFAPRRRGNGDRLPFFEPPVALELVDRAADEGVPVVRVAGVFVGPTGPQRDLEHFADFSAGVAQGHGCWADAQAFIEARRALGLVFEIVLGDDPLEVV